MESRVSRTVVRIVSAAAGLLLVSLVLVGCGSAQGASGATLRIWYSTDDPAERAWSQALVRPFEAAHPDIHVQLTPYSFADLNTKLQLALTAGNPPDLAYVTPRGPGIPAYVAAHRLLDLSAAARAHGWARRLRPGLLAAYNRPFAFVGARPGSVVAVPTSLAAVGVLYNRALLRRLHLTIPTSVAALERAAARARAAGYTAIGIGNADGWVGDDWYLTLVNSQVPPAALAAEQRLDPRFSFERKPYLGAALTLHRLAAANYLTQDFGGLDAQEGIDVFFQGKTLFQLVSSSENPQILKDERQTRLPIGVFAFPAANGARTMPAAGYLGWVIPRAGQHQQEAIAFIDSLLSPATAHFLAAQGVLPAQRVRTPVVTQSWQQDYLHALNSARPGVYLDAAPVANLNATMEANVQLLLQGYEQPQFLVQSLQKVYVSHGKNGSTARIDGEF